mgnify:CR=1 FL=1
MNKIIVIGSGGHARSCIDVIERENKFEIAGIVNNNNENRTSYPIIGNDNDLENLRSKYSNALIGIGFTNDIRPRLKILEILTKLQFNTPSIVSPFSYVSKMAIVKKGTIIMHGVVINANVIIGQNCIINSCALIEHDSVIGDNCHVSTRANINGEVTIGQNTFVGSNVTIRNGISINQNQFLKMGLSVKENI